MFLSAQLLHEPCAVPRLPRRSDTFDERSALPTDRWRIGPLTRCGRCDGGGRSERCWHVVLRIKVAAQAAAVTTVGFTQRCKVERTLLPLLEDRSGEAVNISTIVVVRPEQPQLGRVCESGGQRWQSEHRRGGGGG